MDFVPATHNEMSRKMIAEPDKKSPIRVLQLFPLISIAATAFADAEDFGDPYRGREFATKVCVECHGVLPEDITSPKLESPTFKVIANTPGITRIALTAWFQTPHPTMPNLIIEGEDLDNVISYILSLKDKR